MKKINLKFLFALLFLSVLFACSSSDENTPDTPDEPDDPMSGTVGIMRDISSMQLVDDMKPGWNLGNTLDAEGENETVWGNPAATKAMIDALAERGFGTLRIPVTWRFHMGPGPDYTIETAWLNRVEEVVNYALDNDMYAIINIHHDDEWIIPTYAQADAVKDRLAKVWTQIANRFKDYSDYLIFETLNEPRHENTPEEWIGGTAEGRDVVNQYHKASIDAIRATGGNNALRQVMISSYAASQAGIDDLVIPNNDPRTIVSLHYYFPFQFCLTGEDPDWGTDQDKASLDGALDDVYNRFISNNKPVIMGEWGSTNQDDSNYEDRLEHATYYANACMSRKILPVWWDNGYQNEFGIFNRQTLGWHFPDIADAIINSDQ